MNNASTGGSKARPSAGTATLLAGLALLLIMASVPAAPVRSAAPAAPGAAVNPADLVLTDAKIYTADAAKTMAAAVAVRAGRIVYVGSSAGVQPFVGSTTKLEHLGGRVVLPGLIDSHIHPSGILDLDVCDLKSAPKSLREITDFVRGCIDHYKIPAGEWVNVRMWNFGDDNVPDAAHPTLRAALDLASQRHPIQLLGNDGHHGAFNSMALAQARSSTGQTVGYSKATLKGAFHAYRGLIGVDTAGEPNGTVNEQARRAMGVPWLITIDFPEVIKAPERVTARLNSLGITGILDAAVAPEHLRLYDTLEKSGKLTVRAALAQHYDPDLMRTTAGQPDWDRMLSSAKAIRAKYAHDPLIRADTVKLFADGILEGNPYATPPTLPEVATLKPYLQPIFKTGKDGHPSVTGYADTTAPWCVEARAHPARFDTTDAVQSFIRQHGYHPGQCEISSGELQHDRGVIMEFVRRFHLAGFALHIHTVGDGAVRTALDAIEAARAADGISTQHDALAHVQLAHPDDVKRIGRDHLYVALTYAWAVTDPDYDMSVVPFIDQVHGSGNTALHPPNGYYERNAYPFHSLKAAGAILLAGSDAPVDTRDPRPFVNMATAVTRRVPGLPALNPVESVSIRDVIDAYTINGARYLNLDKDAGSIEVGKSADLVVVNQDILALADGGKADDIANTQVLETYFMGKQVYRRTGP